MAWLDVAAVSLIVLIAAAWSGRKVYLAFFAARSRKTASGCGATDCGCSQSASRAVQRKPVVTLKVSTNLDRRSTQPPPHRSRD